MYNKYKQLPVIISILFALQRHLIYTIKENKNILREIPMKPALHVTRLSAVVFVNTDTAKQYKMYTQNSYKGGKREPFSTIHRS